MEAAKAEMFAEVRENVRQFFAARPNPSMPFCYWFGPGNTHRSWERGSGKMLWGLEPDSLKGRLPGFLPDVHEVREDVCDYLGEAIAFDTALGVLFEELEKRGELCSFGVALRLRPVCVAPLAVRKRPKRPSPNACAPRAPISAAEHLQTLAEIIAMGCMRQFQTSPNTPGDPRNLREHSRMSTSGAGNRLQGSPGAFGDVQLPRCASAACSRVLRRLLETSLLQFRETQTQKDMATHKASSRTPSSWPRGTMGSPGSPGQNATSTTLAARCRWPPGGRGRSSPGGWSMIS